MTGRSALQKYAVLASHGLALLALAGCQTPESAQRPELQALPGGTLDNAGAVIEEPGVFRIAGGQKFTTPFAIGCVGLGATSGGWQAALAAGARKVLIVFPGKDTYGGVLALCRVGKSAIGVEPQSYDLVIPGSSFLDARNGGVATVAQPGWMLWFSDAPQLFGIGFFPPAPTPVALPAEGRTYTALVFANLRSGSSAAEPIIGMLNPGDTVVATGDAKGGFWAVITASGRSGWVWARSLDPKQ